MAKLSHADGRSILASVEYNQLEPLLRAAGKGGDVNDPATGASPYPGNINLLLFRLPAYVAALNYTKGELQEFVNPKYAAGAARGEAAGAAAGAASGAERARNCPEHAAGAAGAVHSRSPPLSSAHPPASFHPTRRAAGRRRGGRITARL